MTEAVAILSESQCWELLASRSVGRLVTCVDDQPEIFPVNYVVQRRTVLFRTGEGAKLISTAMCKGVAFEADDHDADEAWSVIVKGTPRTAHTPEEVEDADSAQVLPWTAGDKEHYVRIVPTTITGRRFQLSRA